MAYLDKLEGDYTEKTSTEYKYHGMVIERSNEVEAGNDTRIYSEDDDYIQLIDTVQGKLWDIDKEEGTYTVQAWKGSDSSSSGSSSGGDIDTSKISEMWTGKYKVGSKSYDAEALVLNLTDKNGTYRMVMICCFDGKVNPEYIISKNEVSKDKLEEIENVHIIDFKSYAMDKYMDFEKILSNYTPASDDTLY
ncbi:MAG: hypothetical protein KH315_04585 [Faecalibacterium prausnitzii]|uniref:Uncharacterized protein n=1 Tax=Faecalibacterium prausnitzii TaxID=853 RepID=A0A9E1GJC9_9FIRM|nr:hypothetical protein [Faecalibacterium prausnitzii]